MSSMPSGGVACHENYMLYLVSPVWRNIQFRGLPGFTTLCNGLRKLNLCAWDQVTLKSISSLRYLPLDLVCMLWGDNLAAVSVTGLIADRPTRPSGYSISRALQLVPGRPRPTAPHQWTRSPANTYNGGGRKYFQEHDQGPPLYWGQTGLRAPSNLVLEQTFYIPEHVYPFGAIAYT